MNNKKKITNGLVVSNKMKKTLVVQVDRITIHEKYHKRYVRSKRYKVHTDDEKQYAIGDKVKFYECRPISKDKKWRIVEEKKKDITKEQ